MAKLSRFDLLILKQMYAPHGVRCCRDHLRNDILRWKLNGKVEIKCSSEFLLALLQEASTAPRLDFTNVSMSKEDYLM